MNIQELIKEEGGEIVCLGSGREHRLCLNGNSVEFAVMAAGGWTRFGPIDLAPILTATLTAHEEAITKKYQPLVDAARKLEGIDFHDSVSIWGCVIDEIQDALSTLDKEPKSDLGNGENKQ